MTRAHQVLPVFFFLFGVTGFLWLAQPPTVAAADARALAPQPPRVDVAPVDARALLASEDPHRSVRHAPRSNAPAQAFSAEQLEALRLQSAERKESRRRAVQERRDREEDAWFAQHANEVATELALPAGSGKELADLLVAERDRQSALWESVRTCGSTPEQRARLREEMRAIRAWRSNEIARRFGAELAPRVEALLDGAESKAQ